MVRALSICILCLIFGCTKRPTNIGTLVMNNENLNKIVKKIESEYRKPADSLKLRAAYFLISELTQQYTLDGISKHQYLSALDYIDTANVLYGSVSTYKFDSLQTVYEKRYGAFNTELLMPYPDVENISSEYLIRNIEHAFYTWDKYSWNDHLSFTDFCEYILPYRSRHEDIEYWRDKVLLQYATIERSVINKKNPVEACALINDLIRKEYKISPDFNLFPIEMSLSQLKKSKTGTCDHAADYVNFICRGLGIAVATDFTPHWANRNIGHSWSVVLDTNNTFIDFVAAGTDPGANILQGKAGKIFRRTFSRNMFPYLENLTDTALIPQLFSEAHFIDVTDEYYKTNDIRLQLAEDKQLPVPVSYLCIFNNLQWKPIFFGEQSGSQVLYRNMAQDICYLPTIYQSGNLYPIGPPIVLDENGNSRFLIPKHDSLINLKLTRKYPVFERIHNFAAQMVNGRFYGTADTGFQQSFFLHLIESIPRQTPNIVHVNPVKVKEVRYFSPENGWGNIAEVKFYNGSKVLIPEKVSATRSTAGNKPERTIDDNYLSYYEAFQPDDVVIKYVFAELVNLTKIEFVPRNDLNNISPGDEYELFYFENGWRSCGKKVAREYHLTYTNIPGGALYWLRNHSHGTEERIFTYENNNQVWW